ncbi:hypothetical protein [Thiomicrorhabdus sp. Milos-T2]|uniref:zinc ribbon-containing protein n=1 Tax=Thiomicrorhabdus sp. Milos-T2 TaxID=90814 RepID=UPI000493CE3E|nr:hypothetical protein [Thiomicrorhabdus sp. Milos-T2]
MSENKMLKAYRALLNNAKEFVIKAENKSWDTLEESIQKAEQADSELGELSAQEFKQVQDDLQADIKQTAQYLADVDQGIEEFIDMDLPVLEQYLADKALSLADPTEITLLRYRLAAAMDENHPVFSKPH